MTEHEIFMQRCFDLANLAGNRTRTNPKVGAVIVYEGNIIGEGYHKEYGGPHAEIEALNNVSDRHKSLIPKSTLYINLEPCAHHGKTPPCVFRIKEEGIRKVVISCQDPNPLVAGKGVEILKESGVVIITDVLLNEGLKMIAPFKAHLNSRPYIILKWAKSKDNFIGKSGERVQLSSQATSILTHKWRSECDGILVGKNTVVTDNPELTTRRHPGDNPVRIILDSNPEIINGHYNVLIDVFKTIIFNEMKEESFHNKEFIKIHDLKNNLKSVVHQLFNRGILNILVEGGSKVLHSFIDENLWDEARIISTPKVLFEGVRAPDVEGKLESEMVIGPDEIVYVRNRSPYYV
ncbi:MAG: bifunctional diaminohydroxyphosphoribosylaminopyrimidine deaminase/5-amino-6-(5-phosphoribosylamino)uracil reductase RibD [Saprospiraceae bacterium]|nr:bifunctional diaminohydroxyphosphoribosylaminopyrimidine deaminase/5-amino-6-(5-phosphoribosylamino)uracil reductase RibD [Saprospiraceae bacterium]